MERRGHLPVFAVLSQPPLSSSSDDEAPPLPQRSELLLASLNTPSTSGFQPTATSTPARQLARSNSQRRALPPIPTPRPDLSGFKKDKNWEAEDEDFVVYEGR